MTFQICFLVYFIIKVYKKYFEKLNETKDVYQKNLKRKKLDSSINKL